MPSESKSKWLRYFMQRDGAHLLRWIDQMMCADRAEGDDAFLCTYAAWPRVVFTCLRLQTTGGLWQHGSAQIKQKHRRGFKGVMKHVIRLRGKA
jgi:hypothetical protein